MERRLFVLGAGASYAAGLPDADSLAAQLFGYIGNAPWEPVRNRPPYAYFKPLNAVLETTMREQQSEDGPQGRWAIAAIFDRFGELLRQDPARYGAAFGQLFEATAQLLYHRSLSGARSAAYRRFVRALRQEDLVLSFNWDVCLEAAMQQAGRRLAREFGSARTGPRLLKVNGSIDHLIVNTSARKGAAAGRPRDADDFWSAFPFLKRLGVAPPPAPDTQWTTSTSRYELARLRTYDLHGYEMSIDGVPPAPIGRDATDEGVTDVGAFALTHALPEAPTFHMIAPGAPPPLFSWYYDAIRSAIAPVAAQIAKVYVVGYSFPVYDLPVIRLLRQIVSAAGEPPAEIVNPDAERLPMQALSYVFGRAAVQRHAARFEAFDWAP